MSKEMIQDDSLNKVVGGFMNFNYRTQILTYKHVETKEVTTYKILNFMKAWEMANLMHAQSQHEDTIMSALKANGYIE